MRVESKKIKLAALVTLASVSLIASCALILLVAQFLHSSRQAVQFPKNSIPVVDGQDFLKLLRSEKSPVMEEKRGSVNQKTAKEVHDNQFRDEAKKIVDCARDSNLRVGLDASGLTPDLIERFKKELQRVANSDKGKRGQAYVSSAASFFCSMITNEAVLQHRKLTPDIYFFETLINFHLENWSDQQERAAEMNANEIELYKSEVNKIEIRVQIEKNAMFFNLIYAIILLLISISLIMYSFYFVVNIYGEVNQELKKIGNLDDQKVVENVIILPLG